MKSSLHVKTNMWTIYRSEVEQEGLVCPYCMTEGSRSFRGCCGEVHYEQAFGLVGTSDWILDSQVDEIIDDIEEVMHV